MWFIPKAGHGPTHRSRWLLPLSLLVGPTGFAQDTPTAQTVGFDAHGFNLAAYDGDPRDLLTVQRPGRFARGDWFVGGLFEFADAPLTFVTYNPANEEELDREPALDDVFALNLSAGLAVHDRIRLDVAFPAYFASVDVKGSPQGVKLGDLRLAAMLALLRGPQGRHGFGLGLLPHLDLPTGDATAFLGNEGMGGGVRAAGTLQAGSFTVTGDAGVQFNPAIELKNLAGSDAIPVGLGVGWLLGDTAGLNLEARFAAPLQANDRAGTASPSEAILSFRKRVQSGPHLTLGGAKSLSQGASAANWRVFAGGGFGRMQAPVPKDIDMDGILNKDDACPEEAETVNGHKDEDGCPDELGKVMVVVEHDSHILRGADLEVTGPDDSQSVVTGVEPLLIEAMPGTLWMANAVYGSCLTGKADVQARDGKVDLIVDMEIGEKAWISYVVRAEDGSPIPHATTRYLSQEPECIPKESLSLDNDGAGSEEVGAGRHTVIIEAPEFALFRGEIQVTPGSDQVIEVTLKPARTRLIEKQIVILDKVYFETAKARIKPESFTLLDEVVNVILANPQIRRIEVAGHTDAQGDDQYNQQLSDDRASTVRDYLVDGGVNAGILIAMGYGESRPIDNNTTASGRARNRRVEFNILEVKQ